MFWIWKLCSTCAAYARGQICSFFGGNWAQQNQYDRWQRVKFRKSQEVLKSFHPSGQGTCCIIIIIGRRVTAISLLLPCDARAIGLSAGWLPGTSILPSRQQVLQSLHQPCHTLSQRKSIFRNIAWNVAGKKWYNTEYFMYYPLYFMLYRENLDYFSNSVGLIPLLLSPLMFPICLSRSSSSLLTYYSSFLLPVLSSWHPIPPASSFILIILIILFFLSSQLPCHTLPPAMPFLYTVLSGSSFILVNRKIHVYLPNF